MAGSEYGCCSVLRRHEEDLTNGDKREGNDLYEAVSLSL